MFTNCLLSEFDSPIQAPTAKSFLTSGANTLRPPSPSADCPDPRRPDGRPITEYPDFELTKLMRWIMSDDVPRTTEELVTIGTKELGYKARGKRIVAALEKAVGRARAQEERERRTGS